ncbi:MAG: DUF429 domain-containing protein [Anaerolineales bacterium]|nr:DUF429 domain-containing protein [Anaerolineales bacterium]
MSHLNPVCVGIDPTAGRQPFTWSVLDPDCHLLSMAAGELEDVLALLAGMPSAFVAVNAPPRPNQGLVKRRPPGSQAAGAARGADMRLAEYELRRRGIAVSPTPVRAELSPAWMQTGYELYRQMGQLGFKPCPTKNAERQVLETHPHAAFCALLGILPLAKPTLEGRLQRQLVLCEARMGIRDPMEFFEEITRHKLLKGVLPMEFIYASEELDALVAAYTAWMAGNSPEAVTRIGDAREGQVTLPVKEILEKYS